MLKCSTGRAVGIENALVVLLCAIEEVDVEPTVRGCDHIGHAVVLRSTTRALSSRTESLGSVRYSTAPLAARCEA